jgi:hypothetical protein
MIFPFNFFGIRLPCPFFRASLLNFDGSGFAQPVIPEAALGDNRSR